MHPDAPILSLLEDVVALRDFLYWKFVGKTTIATNLAKSAAKFDRLVYGPDFVGDVDELRTVLAATGVAKNTAPSTREREGIEN